jgi:hypothetical protein
LVTGGAFGDCNTYDTTDGCSAGLPHEKEQMKEACDQHDYCYHGPIKGSFHETYRHCTDLFWNVGVGINKALADAWVTFMKMDPVYNGGDVSGPGFGDAFQSEQMKTEKRCLLGRSVPSGYGGTPCWGGGTFCLVLTTCYNCCNGDQWSKCN